MEELARLQELENSKKERTHYKGLKDSEIDEHLDKLIEPGPQEDPRDLLPKNLKYGEVVNEIAQLTEGGAFGELALVFEKPRMATVKCIERCHFIVLSKSEYNGALKEIDRRKTNDLINFIKMLPVFKKLSRSKLINYTYNLKSQECIREGYIYREGEPANTVYIIREGEFQIQKRVKIKKGGTKEIDCR